MAAATAYAAASAVLTPRVPKLTPRCSALPHLPPRGSFSSLSIKQVSGINIVLSSVKENVCI